jgi:hypothetical protein
VHSHQKLNNYTSIKCVNVLHEINEYELIWFQHLKRTYDSNLKFCSPCILRKLVDSECSQGTQLNGMTNTEVVLVQLDLS